MFLLGALFAAGLGFTACSSEKDVAEVTPQSGFGENGVGYLSIGINLPTGNAATRANGTFEDGETNEHAANDVILALFTNTTDNEDGATCVYAKSLTGATWNTGTGEVTKYNQYTEQLNSSDFNTYIYALAIINGASNKNADGTQDLFSVVGGKLYCLGSPVTTFGTLKALHLDNIGNATNGFLMTTAPYATDGGKDNNPSTSGVVYQLNNVTSNIKSTAALAEASRAKIYVERAAAKVTVKASATSGTTTGGTALSYDGIYCILDNYNTEFFPTRHFDASSTINSVAKGWLSVNNTTGEYRMVEEKDYEGTAKASSTLNMYRTTWGEDINYDSNTGLTFQTGERLATSAMTEVTTSGVSTYCAENTISDDNMTWDKTTRVVAAVKFNNGNSFWTASTYGNVILTGSTATKIEDLLTNPYLNTTIKADLDNAVSTWVTSNIVSTNQSTVNSYTKTYAITTGTTDFTITFSTPLTNADFVDVDGNGSAGEAADKTAAEALLKKALYAVLQSKGYKFYENGLAYYSIRIKHFGDVETPWSGSGNTYDTVYGANDDTRTNSYLGRYGVLRNNWYTLTINSVKGLGEPTIPEIPDTPDDLGESYLSVSINILKWGIRNQNADL